MLATSSCAWVGVPDARNVDIPSPTMAKPRKNAINERPDSIMYLPLGEDVLVPEAMDDESFPHEFVGPFELRGETLAGALQLILADYDIALAFETEQGLTRRVTVANLRGDLGKVVNQVCALANLYCSYENGSVTVKDTQTFTVTLPPIGTRDETDYLDNIAAGLAAILGADVPAPIVDPTTRTIVYSATQRTSEVATRYFQRLRANTAMIVFETYIWEVSLDAGNSAGINWSNFDQIGKFNVSAGLAGAVGADFLNPISIGLPTTQDIDATNTELLEFLSQYGAVKTISQPQITVLSGSQAELRVADTQNYVSQIATTLSEGQATTSVNTDSVDTGFTLSIGSSWDKSTVYANIDIELTDVKQIDNFAFSDEGVDGTETRIQLPQTSERQLTTQIRMRPGDSVLIAGLVRENDNFQTDGVGFMKPIIPQSRTAQTQNLELVIMLRPRVIIYTAANDKRYMDYALKKHKLPGTGVALESPKEAGDDLGGKNVPLRVLSDDTISPAAPQPLNRPVPVETPVLAPVPLAPVAPPAAPVVQQRAPDPVTAPAPLSPIAPIAPIAPRTSRAPVEPVMAPRSSIVPVSAAPVSPAPVAASPAAAPTPAATVQSVVTPARKPLANPSDAAYVPPPIPKPEAKPATAVSAAPLKPAAAIAPTSAQPVVNVIKAPDFTARSLTNPAPSNAALPRANATTAPVAAAPAAIKPAAPVTSNVDMFPEPVTSAAPASSVAKTPVLPKPATPTAEKNQGQSAVSNIKERSDTDQETSTGGDYGIN